MSKPVTILTENPTLELIAQQQLVEPGILKMAEWVQRHRPNCVPEAGFNNMWDLLPHDRTDKAHGYYEQLGGTERAVAFANATKLTDNEVLCEIAGRSCYHSFADAAGRKTNKEYFEHIFSMDPQHASILYHSKMTFFFAGVSRKFSHQFIRNYVGSDRDEEGSPSQTSTRFTHHDGFYIAPPHILDQPEELELFRADCQHNYDEYFGFIERQIARYDGKVTTGQKKDVYEAAAGKLNMSAETSFVWTANALSLRKFLKERCHQAADAEIFRFAGQLAKLCFEKWPNLFIGADLDGVRREIAL